MGRNPCRSVLQFNGSHGVSFSSVTAVPGTYEIISVVSQWQRTLSPLACLPKTLSYMQMLSDSACLESSLVLVFLFGMVVHFKTISTDACLIG